MSKSNRLTAKPAVCVVAIGLALSGCDSQQKSDPIPTQAALPDSLEITVTAPVSQEDLRSAFARANTSELVRVLNEVKFTDLDFELISDVECAYIHCVSAPEEWNWQTISSPYVHINIVDVLIQADRRGMPTQNLERLIDDVRAGLNSVDPNVVHQSMLTLSYLDRPEDVGELIATAQSVSNPTTFRISVIALQNMSNSESDTAVARLIADASDAERAAISDLLNELPPER